MGQGRAPSRGALLRRHRHRGAAIGGGVADGAAVDGAAAQRVGIADAVAAGDLGKAVAPGAIEPAARQVDSAPPEGGIATGVDRTVMILAGLSNARETIAFPKTQTGYDPLLDAPAPIDPKQLEDLGLRVVAKPDRPST